VIKNKCNHVDANQRQGPGIFEFRALIFFLDRDSNTV